MRSIDVTLVLASASPRRHQLLRQLGVEFDVDPAEIDERCQPGEQAEDYVVRVAREKSRTVFARHPGACVLAADTTVAIDNDVLGKPQDHYDGLAMLARLSGRKHRVLTAVCVTDPRETRDLVVATEVKFVNLTRAECEAYLATQEPCDKAGAYAIQGLGGAFIESINGSHSNVIGLPLNETWRMLEHFGIPNLLSSHKESPHSTS